MNCKHCSMPIEKNIWFWSAADLIHSKSQSRFCDGANTQATKGTFCAGCQDVEVERVGMICNVCRASEASDWVTMADYEDMQAMAYVSDEIHNIKQFIPSLRESK